MTTKITARELADDIILTEMLASKSAKRNEVIDRLLVTQRGRAERSYEIEIKINGIELDFRDFTTEVERQLSELVARAARSLINERVEDRIKTIYAAIDDLRSSARALASSLEDDVRATLGLLPSNHEE